VVRQWHYSAKTLYQGRRTFNEIDDLKSQRGSGFVPPL